MPEDYWDYTFMATVWFSGEPNNDCQQDKFYVTSKNGKTGFIAGFSIFIGSAKASFFLEAAVLVITWA